MCIRDSNGTVPADDIIDMKWKSGAITSNAGWQTNGLHSIGYTAGAGGAVTQATSRTTGVTLNAPAGRVTLVSAAGSTTPAKFTLTNSLIGLNDTIIVNVKNTGTQANVYDCTVNKPTAAGSVDIWFWSISGTAVDVFAIDFTIIGGATA